jgi:hypothetical protein
MCVLPSSTDCMADLSPKPGRTVSLIRRRLSSPSRLRLSRESTKFRSLRSHLLNGLAKMVVSENPQVWVWRSITTPRNYRVTPIFSFRLSGNQLTIGTTHHISLSFKQTRERRRREPAQGSGELRPDQCIQSCGGVRSLVRKNNASSCQRDRERPTKHHAAEDEQVNCRPVRRGKPWLKMKNFNPDAAYRSRNVIARVGVCRRLCFYPRGAATCNAVICPAELKLWQIMGNVPVLRQDDGRLKFPTSRVTGSRERDGTTIPFRQSCGSPDRRLGARCLNGTAWS